MNRINSHTEWGTLKEVILGRAENIHIPLTKGKDIHCIDYALYDTVEGLPGGYYSEQIIEETKEDLDLFQNQLLTLGIKVLRPEIFDSGKQYANPYWQSEGYYSYCPRDSVLVVGDLILETPMPLRSRYFETFAFRKILKQFMSEGSKWLSAPKPELMDELYDKSNLTRPTLRNIEPAFDAANILRCGKDLIYLVSNTGNELGAEWLKILLGDSYNIHLVKDVYAYVHIDTTIMPLKPGVVLLNPDRVQPGNVPSYFRNWKHLYAAPAVETPYLADWAPSTHWLGMNVLSLSENLVAVEKSQVNIIKQLEQEGFDVMPVQLRHCRTLGGGPHCITLDTIRDDEYGDYS